MVEVPTPTGGSYCIDSTEVTQSQYAIFLASKQGDTSGQPKECQLNKTFTPPSYDPDVETDDVCVKHKSWAPGERPDWPVACVDWCDAVAYCAWAGKRLCGKIGGGSVEKDKGNEVSESQWYNACSQGGKMKYPYGNEFKPEACVQKDSALGTINGESTLAPVKAAKECMAKEGDFAGIHDLTGNASEWEDNCFDWTFPDGSMFRQCFIRGGGPYESGTPSKINSCSNIDGAPPIWLTNPGIGFRCCKD
jgi:formylglycine-generating enzyme required for sulfatase activity